jgi:hypothetical protein
MIRNIFSEDIPLQYEIFSTVSAVAKDGLNCRLPV